MSVDNNKGIFDFKGFVPERVKQLIELLHYSEVQAFLKLFIDSSIATSELQILKRLANVEKALELNDFFDFKEEHEQTIPEQLSLLAGRIDAIGSNPITYPIDTLELLPHTKTEVRASLLVSHLKNTGNDHLNSHEIIHFLKCKLPEGCKINENIQNIRKVKQDVLKAAKNMYPNVFLNKKRTGRREVRLVLAT
jgi:hypothetical protein